MEMNWGLRPRPVGVRDSLGEPGNTPAPPDAAPVTLAPVRSSPSGEVNTNVESRPIKASAGIHGDAGPIPATAEDFAQLALASQVLEPPQWEAWKVRQFASLHALSGAELSAALVKEKLLTPYQAGVLLGGQSRGLVLGKYEILCPLGEGGMGAVYRARHRRMKREVALKVLPRDLMKSAAAVQRFHREVQAAAKLHHPNIAAAYDADEDDGVHFLVMELVEGPDLAGYVAEAGELPAPVAVQLTIQAARGLAHAHLQGVVHRDIKPANLVVNVQGTLKILDMGLAQLRTSGPEAGRDLTQMGQTMGTIDYMAPEQAVDAHSVDHRADIYSLGCTLFYLLTARAISPEGSIVQKLLWHQAAPRPSLLETCVDANERLNIIFQRMVAASADERYGMMRDVVEDLERVLPELRLGDSELPLIGDDLALYIGMDALAPKSQSAFATGGPEHPLEPAPLHATLPPQKSALVTHAESAPAVGLVEQQLAAAAIMIGKEVSAETSAGRRIRGVVDRLSVEAQPGNPQLRVVLLHVGAASFGLHEIREVFCGNGSTNT